MDNNSKSLDLADMGAVWQRVTTFSDSAQDFTQPSNTCISSSEEHPDSESAQILSFMDSEAASARLYHALMQRCSGQTRAMFQRMYSDERRHLRTLQSVYFLITGKRYTPAAQNIQISSAAQSLQGAYKAENNAYNAYNDAAGKTKYPSLANAYFAMADDEYRHARTIMDLISRTF